MPEAQAVTKTEGNHDKGPAPTNVEQPVPDAQTTPAPPLASAAHLGGAPPDDPTQRYRATLQRLPSDAMRRQLAAAIGRQHGNAVLQRVLVADPAPPGAANATAGSPKGSPEPIAPGPAKDHPQTGPDIPTHGAGAEPQQGTAAAKGSESANLSQIPSGHESAADQSPTGAATQPPSDTVTASAAPAASPDHGEHSSVGSPEHAEGTGAGIGGDSNADTAATSSAPQDSPVDNAMADAGVDGGSPGPVGSLGNPLLDRTAQAILATVDVEKAALRQSGAAEQQSALEHADTQAQALIATADSRAEALGSAVAQTRTGLSEHIAAEHTQVLQALDTHKNAVRASESQAIGRVQQQGATHTQAVSNTAQSEARQAGQAGSEQGQRATGSAAAAAGRVTDAARSPAASGLVGRLVGFVRDRLLGGIGNGVQKFIQHGAELARGAVQMAGRLSQGLRDAGTKVVGAISDTAGRVIQRIQGASQSLVSHLTSVAHGVAQTLNGALQTVTGALNKVLAGVGALRKAGLDAAASARRGGQRIAGQIQAAVGSGLARQDSLARQIVGLLHGRRPARLAPGALSTFEQAAVGALRNTRGKSTEAVTAFAAQARTRFAQLLPTFRGRLAQGEQRIQGQLSATSTGVAGAAQKAGQEATAVLGQAAGAGQQAHQQAALQFGAQVGQQAARTQQGLSEARAKNTADLASKVTAGIADQSTAQQNAVGQVNTFAQSAATQAAGKDKGWWEGIKEGASQFFEGLSQFVLYVEIGAAAIVAVQLAGGAALTVAMVAEALAFAAAIIGTVLLIYALVLDWQRRWEQYKSRPEYASESGVSAFFAWVGVGVIAILDVLGIGLIIEAIVGQDLVTGRKLSDEEKGARLSMGILTFLALILARKADEGLRGKEPAVPGEKPKGGDPAEVAGLGAARAAMGTRIGGLMDSLEGVTKDIEALPDTAPQKPTLVKRAEALKVRLDELKTSTEQQPTPEAIDHNVKPDVDAAEKNLDTLKFEVKEGLSRSDGQPVSDAAVAIFEKATPSRKAIFRQNPDFLERFAKLPPDDQAFLNGISDPAFEAFSKLSADLQARFLRVSQHTYTPPTPPGGPAPAPISFRTNFNNLPPARQVSLMTEAEINSMERVEAMDQRYTNEGGQAKTGHGFAEHGAQRSDAEMFARAKDKGFPVSRYNSFGEQEAQAARFRRILEDPTTPKGDDSPINANGHKAIAKGTTTAQKILADPKNNTQFLKSRVTFKQRPAGHEVGTEFDPDGVTKRPVEHVTAIFELDSNGRYQVLTNFPEKL